MVRDLTFKAISILDGHLTTLPWVASLNGGQEQGS